jgi:hypothetical protein
MKKMLLLILVIGLLQKNLSAQVTMRNILQNKYSLAQIQSSLIVQSKYKPFPTTPEEWKLKVPDSILKHMIQEAEGEMTFKFEPITASVALSFVRTGDRSEHAAVSYAKRAVLLKFIIAESIEKKGRFIEPIVNGLWSICEESFWGVPAHIPNTGLPDVDEPVVELFSAETATLMALTDYLVGDQLDQINPLLRKRMYSETNRRVFEPMLTKSSGYGWMSKSKPVNNWNPWIMSNWIMANLLLEKDNTKRALMIHHAMVGLDSYINSLGDEGGCDEGPSYWFAAGGSTYDCLEMLAGATNGLVNIYDVPLIQKMGAYIYKTHIGAKYFVDFSDADAQVVADGLMIYRFGKAIKDNNLMQMGNWAYHAYNYEQYSFKKNRENFYKPRFIQNLLTIQQLPPYNNVYEQPKDIWVSDVQVMTARSEDGLFLATHAGHNAESHNHNDVGDFIVYANNEPLIIDVGRGNYTARTFSSHRYELWFTQSEHHNLPIVNGKGQLAGRNFEANQVQYSQSNNTSSLSMNIATAYDSAAGIKYWNRLVAMNRSKNQIEINDAASFVSKKNQVQQIFMTTCRIDTTKKGVIVLTTPNQQSYAINYNAKNVNISISNPSMEGAEYSSFKAKWNNLPIARIVLNNEQLGQKANWQYTISKQIK